MTSTAEAMWKVTPGSSTSASIRQFHDGFRGSQLRVQYEGDREPEWLVQVTARLDHLLNLEKDWDSYGAAPIESEAVSTALRWIASCLQVFPEAPFIAPLADGGVQVEWTHGSVEVGFTVRTAQPPQAFIVTDVSEDQWFLDRSEGLARLLRALRATAPAS